MSSLFPNYRFKLLFSRDVLKSYLNKTSTLSDHFDQIRLVNTILIKLRPRFSYDNKVNERFVSLFMSQSKYQNKRRGGWCGLKEN